MSYMSEVFTAVCEASDASADGQPRYVYHAVDHSGGHRDFFSPFPPESPAIQRLIGVSKRVLLTGVCRDGWSEETPIRLLELERPKI